MADATTRLRAEKQAYDSNDDAWGTHLNAGVFDVLDQAIAGVIGVAVNAPVTLDVQNFISDQARNAGLILTGAGGFVITVPAVQKLYAVVNLCAADVTITPMGGTGSVIRAGTGVTWLTDGTTGRTIDNTLDKVKAPAGPVAMAGQRVTGLGAPVDAGDAVPKSYADAIINAAAGSATAAANSAQAASDSAAATATLFNDFQKRYLGPKAADPTLDNLGAALQAGALYFNTVAGQMRVYTGSAWLVLALPSLSSQAQAEAGSDNTTVMTPLRTRQATDAYVPKAPNAAAVTKADTFALATTNTWTTITGLSVTITPKTTATKVLVAADLNASHSTDGQLVLFRLVRGSTPIGVGTTAGSRLSVGTTVSATDAARVFGASMQVVDAPATTSAVTYSIQMYVINATGYLNRSGSDNDTNSSHRAASSLSAIEVLA